MAAQLDPADTLSVVIEASVALAGFSAVVATLGHRVRDGLGQVLILNLLSTAFSALFLSMLALVLLHSGLPEHLAWICSSSVFLLFGLGAGWVNYRQVIQRRVVEVTQTIDVVIRNFWFGSAVVINVLQLWNIFSTQRFWPLLLGIVWLFALSCYSFVRLLTRPDQ